MVAFAVLGTMLGLIIIALQVHPLSMAQRSKAWPTVTGRIIESRVVRRYSRRSRSSYAVIRYAYAVAGTEYVSRRIAFSGIFSPNLSAAAARRYPRGQSVQVHYDPASPDRAVVETRVTSGVWLTLLLGIGISAMAGFVVLYFGLPSVRRITNSFAGAILRTEWLVKMLAWSPQPKQDTYENRY